MDELSTLQKAIENGIRQKKREIHPSHNRVDIDSLRIEIETLQWVLDQMLILNEEEIYTNF
jgi:hypothetical protein